MKIPTEEWIVAKNTHEAIIDDTPDMYGCGKYQIYKACTAHYIRRSVIEKIVPVRYGRCVGWRRGMA